MTDHVAVLETARELLARPHGWTQGSYAKTALGLPCNTVFDGDADKFCITGAILRASGGDGRTFGQAMAALKRQCAHPVQWQDDPRCTQRAVLRLFDQVIRTEQERLGLAVTVAEEVADED